MSRKPSGPVEYPVPRMRCITKMAVGHTSQMVTNMINVTKMTIQSVNPDGHSRKNRKSPALPRAHPLTCLIKTEKGKGFQWSVGPFLSGLYQFGVNIYMLVLLIYKCNV